MNGESFQWKVFTSSGCAGLYAGVYFQMLRQFGNGFLHPFDDALGDLVGTVRIKVRIVCKIPGLSGYVPAG